MLRDGWIRFAWIRLVVVWFLGVLCLMFRGLCRSLGCRWLGSLGIQFLLGRSRVSVGGGLVWLGTFLLIRRRVVCVV